MESEMYSSKFVALETELGRFLGSYCVSERRSFDFSYSWA